MDLFRTDELDKYKVIQTNSCRAAEDETIRTTIKIPGSIPTSTDGCFIMEGVHHPMSIEHILKIDVLVCVSEFYEDDFATAILFENDEEMPLVFSGVTSESYKINLIYYYPVKNLDRVCFKVRLGSHLGRVTFNGSYAYELFGEQNREYSEIVITELGEKW